MLAVSIAKCGPFIAASFYSFTKDVAICIQEVVDKNIVFADVLKYKMTSKQVPSHMKMTTSSDKTYIIVSRYYESIDIFQINSQKKLVHTQKEVKLVENSKIESISIRPLDASAFLAAGKGWLKSIRLMTGV